MSLLRLLSDPMARAVDVEVVLFRDGPLAARLREAGVPTTVLAAGARLGSLTRTDGFWPSVRAAADGIPLLVRLAAVLRSRHPDLVVTTTLKSHLAGVMTAPVAGAPLAWHLHDRIAPDYLPGPAVVMLRTLARIPRVVVANSKATAATIPRARRIVVAPPGLAPEQVRGEPRPRPGSGLGDGRDSHPGPVVGMLGRIAATKGQREFLAAAALVRDDFPTARFRIVGSAMFADQDYDQFVDADIVRLGLGDVVSRVAHVADPAVELDGFTVCVHASPVPEPFGQVVVEAMARGVPVVATDAGGIPEILRPPGEAPLGWLVPPGDVAALADAICAVLADPQAAQARVDLAWERARRDFPIERTARSVVAAWSAAAADPISCGRERWLGRAANRLRRPGPR